MSTRPVDVVRFIARSSKRVAVSVVGGVFLIAGLAMLVLPGPGFLIVVIGFAILGTEYAWAAAALARTKSIAEKSLQMAKQNASKAGRAAGSVTGSVSRKVRRSRR